MSAQSTTNAQITTISPINSPRSDKACHNAERLLNKLDLKSSFPFDNNFIDTSMGAMHFIDEGQGEPILMVHGNPTWSYLYRAFIAEFAGTYRVIAPDHIGFGLSEKPSDEGAYTIDQHIQNLETLVNTLDLRNITLVIQDWGGRVFWCCLLRSFLTSVWGRSRCLGMNHHFKPGRPPQHVSGIRR